MTTAYDPEEVEREIQRHRKLVYYVIHRYFPYLREDEDAAQIGMIALWKAVVSYESGKSQFATYAIQCIKNALRREIQSRAQLWKLGEAASLDEPLYYDSNGSAVTLAHLTPDPGDGYFPVDNDLSFLGDKLTERDLRIFRLYLRGFTVVEMSQDLGCSREWVYQSIRRAQAMCREEILQA